MTTTLSKIMTVFVTITCVGVMAGILANVMAGGPNWKAKAALIPEAVFDRANPEAPWTAKRKGGTEDLGGRSNPASSDRQCAEEVDPAGRRCTNEA